MRFKVLHRGGNVPVHSTTAGSSGTGHRPRQTDTLILASPVIR
jgi:hypothetical protein